MDAVIFHPVDVHLPPSHHHEHQSHPAFPSHHSTSMNIEHLLSPVEPSFDPTNAHGSHIPYNFSAAPRYWNGSLDPNHHGPLPPSSEDSTTYDFGAPIRAPPSLLPTPSPTPYPTQLVGPDAPGVYFSLSQSSPCIDIDGWVPPPGMTSVHVHIPPEAIPHDIRRKLVSTMGRPGVLTPHSRPQGERRRGARESHVRTEAAGTEAAFPVAFEGSYPAYDGYHPRQHRGSVQHQRSSPALCPSHPSALDESQPSPPYYYAGAPDPRTDGYAHTGAGAIGTTSASFAGRIDPMLLAPRALAYMHAGGTGLRKRGAMALWEEGQGAEEAYAYGGVRKRVCV
ncbi:hypothetical protein OF83DRAFT_228790 [Amylostereum chailletii]|nr:hypothetical protein OF83DRAFT_228790 [Amylostereum chailletii]